MHCCGFTILPLHSARSSGRSVKLLQQCMRTTYNNTHVVSRFHGLMLYSLAPKGRGRAQSWTIIMMSALLLLLFPFVSFYAYLKATLQMGHKNRTHASKLEPILLIWCTAQELNYLSAELLLSRSGWGGMGFWWSNFNQKPSAQWSLSRSQKPRYHQSFYNLTVK